MLSIFSFCKGLTFPPPFTITGTFEDDKVLEQTTQNVHPDLESFHLHVK